MYRYLVICAFWHVFVANCIRVHEDEEEEKDRKYSFKYSVDDGKSGNIQSREEERLQDGSLQGQYSAHFPDGFKRTVVYKVHAGSGFVATVHKEKIANCYHCKEATPFSIGYEVQHGNHVRSFFYMDSGVAAQSTVQVDSGGVRTRRKTKHLSPLIRLS